MTRTATGKKFEITDLEPLYQPREQEEPDFETIEELTSDFHGNHHADHKLYLTREALTQLDAHIGWGRHTELNRVEQGGILIGQVFRDSRKGLVYGVVEAVIAGRSARGTSAHLEMGHETWNEMLDSVDEILGRHSEKEWRVMGWYHTHPNELSIYMSGTDQATQRRLFAQDWQFAIVLNPHHGSWRAFFGNDAHECRGYIIAAGSEFPPTQPTLHAREAANQPADCDNDMAVDDEPPSQEADDFDDVRTLTSKAPPILWACFLLLLLILLVNLLLLYLQARRA